MNRKSDTPKNEETSVLREEYTELFSEEEEAVDFSWDQEERLDLVYPKEKEEEPEEFTAVTTGHGKAIVTVFLLVIALFALVAVMTRGFGLWIKRSYTLREEGVFKTSVSRLVGTVGGTVLSGDTEGLSAYDSDGNLVYNVSYHMAEPLLDTCGSYAVVYDSGRNLANVVSEEGFLYRVQPLYPIVRACVQNDGSLLVIGQKDLESEILVFSPSGKEMLRRVTKSATDGQPMAAALSDDGNLLVTAYTRFSGTKLEGIITFFDLSTVGGIYSDRLLANFTYDDTLFTDCWFSDGKLVAFGDNRIVTFDAGTAPAEVSSRQLTHQIRQMVHTGEGYAVLYGTETMHSEESLVNQLVFYNTAGEKTFRTETENIVLLQAFGSRFIWGDGYMYYAVNRDGSQVWKLQSTESIRQFYPLSEKRLLAVTADSMQWRQVVEVEENS